MELKINTWAAKIFGMDSLILFEDTIYIMKRESHEPEFADKVENLRTNYRNGMIAGGAFGLALTMSLRRYFPGTFSHISLNRVIIELTILSGTLFGSTVSVTFGAAKFTHNYKKHLILSADTEIYDYLKHFEQKYRVPEQTHIRYMLSKSQFEEWKKYRGFSVNRTESTL